MSNPILSICIPTYSRSYFLRECLDSISLQFSDPAVAEQVEIVISDNASIDDTQELVKKYQDEYTNIRYGRNARNLGYDRNVSAALSLGRGLFRWLISDDEMLDKDALKFLLPLLQSHPEVAYFCVDHGALRRNKDWEKFSDGNAWLENLGLTGGLISQNIYNSKFLPADISKYYDNLWIHFSVALEIMARQPGVLVKKLFLDPTIPRKTTWAAGGHAFTTYNCLNQIIRGLPSLGYNPRVIRKLLMGMAKGLFRNIASAKVNGLKISGQGLKILIREYCSYPFWLSVALLVYLTPKKLIKAVHWSVT